MEKWFYVWEISDNPKIIALFSKTSTYQQHAKTSGNKNNSKMVLICGKKKDLVQDKNKFKLGYTFSFPNLLSPHGVIQTFF